MWRPWDSILSPERSPQDNRRATCDVHLDLGNGFESCWVYPGGFVLVATRELFMVPGDILLTVHDLSTLARQAITVGNTVIQPGSRGYQTIEVWNHGPRPFALRQGMPIAQLVQHQVCAQSYEGRYQDQTRGPHEARP